MVLRDHDGQFRGGKNLRLAGTVSVLEAEAIGVQEALSWIREMPTQQVTIETDSLLLVNAIQKNISY